MKPEPLPAFRIGLRGVWLDRQRKHRTDKSQLIMLDTEQYSNWLENVLFQTLVCNSSPGSSILQVVERSKQLVGE